MYIKDRYDKDEKKIDVNSFKMEITEEFIDFMNSLWRSKPETESSPMRDGG